MQGPGRLGKPTMLSRLSGDKQVSQNDSLEITGFFGQLLEEELIFEQSSIEGGQNLDKHAPARSRAEHCKLYGHAAAAEKC
jgi:hypothetical protein